MKEIKKTETIWKRENLKQKLINLAISVSFPLYFHSRIAVMEIGCKSASCLGAVGFGTGRMLASFYCSGTVDVTSERLKR